jgi:hypothetical protein
MVGACGGLSGPTLIAQAAFSALRFLRKSLLFWGSAMRPTVNMGYAQAPALFRSECFLNAVIFSRIIMPSHPVRGHAPVKASQRPWLVRGWWDPTAASERSLYSFQRDFRRIPSPISD